MSKILSEWDRYAASRISIDWLKNPLHFERLMYMKSFLDDPVNHMSFDCGCGEKEPVIICNHPNLVALDISLVALENLKALGFKGHLLLGHCLFLPFKDKCFEKSISSELIEHLNSKREVLAFKKEIERVSASIMLTTPNNDFLFRWSDPTHKLFFNSENTKEIFDDYRLSQAGSPWGVLTYYLRSFIRNRYANWLYLKMKGSIVPKIRRLLERVTRGGAFIILRK